MMDQHAAHEKILYERLMKTIENRSPQIQMLTVPEVIYGNVTPTWEEQFSYEVAYAKNVSFLLDVKIIWNTVKIIFKRVQSDYGSEVRQPLNVERAYMVRK